jgi:hypothetical protein
MAEDDALIREVNDAVRADRLHRLWQQYRWPVFAAALMLVFVTAGNSVWRHYQRQQAEAATLAFAEAQAYYQREEFAIAAKKFEQLRHQARGSLADVVKLWQARALMAQQKTKAATRVLQNIVIAPEGHDLYWRDQACLHLISLGSNAGVPPVCHGKTPSPLAPVLMQMNAARLWQEGNTREAKALLEQLQLTAETPALIRQQSGSWGAVMRSQKKQGTTP